MYLLTLKTIHLVPLFSGHFYSVRVSSAPSVEYHVKLPLKRTVGGAVSKA